MLDRAHPIGKLDAAGLADVVLESAITTIADFEDSIAAVDAEDKIAAYRNWLGLMKGDLEAEFEKSGQVTKRKLAKDRDFLSPDGKPFDPFPWVADNTVKELVARGLPVQMAKDDSGPNTVVIKLIQIEKRLHLVESELKGSLDLSPYLIKPVDLPGDREPPASP